MWISCAIVGGVLCTLAYRGHASAIPQSSAQLSTIGATSALVNPFGSVNVSTPPDRCWNNDVDYKSTTVETCRPLLDKLRTFVDFNKIQRFEENWSPKLPLKPPFLFKVKLATCELAISAGGTKEVDRFSWRDVRSKATEIIEDCQPPSGLGVGGWDFVGPRNKWFINLRGITPDDAPIEHGGGIIATALDDDSVVYSVLTPAVAKLDVS